KPFSTNALRLRRRFVTFITRDAPPARSPCNECPRTADAAPRTPPQSRPTGVRRPRPRRKRAHAVGYRRPPRRGSHHSPPQNKTQSARGGFRRVGTARRAVPTLRNGVPAAGASFPLRRPPPAPVQWNRPGRGTGGTV